MGKVLYPPNIVLCSRKVIFLAGPIQGAEPWQEKAIKIIQSLDSSIDIACPRRPVITKGDLRGDDYNAQVEWETHYLDRAGQYGVVMFWLAKESEHNCARAYAQTTRFELGEWKARHEFDSKVILVVGVEPGFTNEKYIRRRLFQDYRGINVWPTLQETCEAAVRLYSVRR